MNRKGAKITGIFVNGLGDAPESNKFVNQIVNRVAEPEK